MTKDQIAQELQKEFAQGNLKPSQLKRSKSTGDIPASSASAPPLQKSQSQPVTPQLISPEQTISQLKEQVNFHSQTSQNYLKNLQLAQAKITELEEQLTTSQQAHNELEEQYFAARLKNLQDFGEYYTEKQALKNELELNINESIQEIQRLENKLITLHRKKLAMQEQLKQSELKNTQLELKAIDREQPATQPAFNFNWIIIFSLGVVVLFTWKGEEND